MSADPSEQPTPVARLIEKLSLEALDRDLFLGHPGPGEGRLFGGLVAAQSVMAAGLTVDEGSLHSIHAYFLRPGGHDRPIRFVVDRIRDGRTFTTRRVVAHQAGEAIFNLSASFTRPEEGISHQDPMPDAPSPEGLPDWEALRAERLQVPPRWTNDAIELRPVDPDDFQPGVATKAERKMWMRPRGELPDDPLLHAAFITYASDRTLLSTAGRPHGLGFGNMIGASLDHALWIHHPARFAGWMLYTAESPVAQSARGLIFGAMFDLSGTRIASVAQEGLIRRPRNR